jgi:hypothetical protein
LGHEEGGFGWGGRKSKPEGAEEAEKRAGMLAWGDQGGRPAERQ